MQRSAARALKDRPQCAHGTSTCDDFTSGSGIEAGSTPLFTAELGNKHPTETVQALRLARELLGHGSGREQPAAEGTPWLVA